MKHPGPEDLRALAPFLLEIRKRPHLREKSHGVFYLKSKPFLHFHVDPSGVFADLRVAAEWDRFPVNTRAERGRVLARVDRRLEGVGK
jgi:hypothetical protein